MIMKEQSPAQVKKIRDKFYDLLVNCIDGQTILRDVQRELLVSTARRQEGIKHIVHEEA